MYRILKFLSVIALLIGFILGKPNFISHDTSTIKLQHIAHTVSRAGDNNKLTNNNIKVDKAHKVIYVIATAYTQSKEEGTADGITYTGHKVRRGVVAVDPKVIPLGSKLWVEGYGYGEALDVGGAIKGYRIDLFMESKEEALKWGRKKVKVIILQEGGLINE